MVLTGKKEFVQKMHLYMNKINFLKISDISFPGIKYSGIPVSFSILLKSSKETDGVRECLRLKEIKNCKSN